VGQSEAALRLSNPVQPFDMVQCPTHKRPSLMRTAGDIEDIIMELSRKSGATAGLLGMVGIGRLSSLGPVGV
jgi:hypothetical protein